jgi:hypothetical protein
MRLPKTPLTYLLLLVPSNVVSSHELQVKCVQQLALITIVDWEYQKTLPIADWFNNCLRLWICGDCRRSDAVALPSLLPSQHLRLNGLCLASRGVLTRPRWVLNCMRLVLS